MKLFEKFKKKTEPQPLAMLEKAITRNESKHGFFSVRYDLKKQVKTIGGWVEKNEERVGVVWDSIGLAYVGGKRTKEYDLIIIESYRHVR